MTQPDAQSKAAAVNENVREEMERCEAAYESALLMLRAISPPESPAGGKDPASEEDAQTILRCEFHSLSVLDSH